MNVVGLGLFCSMLRSEMEFVPDNGFDQRIGMRCMSAERNSSACLPPADNSSGSSRESILVGWLFTFVADNLNPLSRELKPTNSESLAHLS